MTTPRRTHHRAHCLALASLLALAGWLVPGAPGASAATPATITLTGHGNGHGVGMGQWGAYGYAVDRGWTAWQIVDHYYGGTVHGSSPLDATVTVRLDALDGGQTAVVSAADLASPGSGWRAMVARRVNGAFTVWATTSSTCPAASDPLAGWQVVASGQPTFAFTTPAAVDTTDPAQLVSVCRPDGSLRAYRGAVSAVADAAGVTHTVNTVPVEQYLRAVVAKEMSPSWANAGSGRGIEALKAQAIAGRSYALSEHLWSFAMTCDSVCQTYQGAAMRAGLSSPFVAVEHPLSDPAVTATAGMVLRNPDGSYAHTMYSASTGGWTIYNAVLKFPAVADDGDATAANPWHVWSRTIGAGTIQAAYPQIGTFTDLTVLARDGNGEWDGRPTSVLISGTAGSRAVTGTALRSALGLPSDWFTVTAVDGQLAGTSTIAGGATALAPARRLRR